MKQLLKITAVICMAAYFYLSFYPLKLLTNLNLLSTSSKKSDSFVFWEQANKYRSEFSLTKFNDVRILKIAGFGRFYINPKLAPHNFLLLKKYIQNNELHFNLPLICYKFPLSEHSEEG